MTIYREHYVENIESEALKSEMSRFGRAHYDFLLPFHSNYSPILYRFPHIARHWSKIAKFIYLTCIQCPAVDDPALELRKGVLIAGKLE